MNHIAIDKPDPSIVKTELRMPLRFWQQHKPIVLETQDIECFLKVLRKRNLIRQCLLHTVLKHAGQIVSHGKRRRFVGIAAFIGIHIFRPECRSQQSAECNCNDKESKQALTISFSFALFHGQQHILFIQDDDSLI